MNLRYKHLVKDIKVLVLRVRIPLFPVQRMSFFFADMDHADILTK